MIRFLILFNLVLQIGCGEKKLDTHDYRTVNVSREFPASLPAGEVIDRIKQKVTCDWRQETVDTYKSGDAETQVTGIATTFLATMDVLKKAQSEGLNLIITHEPTYYNHLDQTDFFESDPVYLAKEKFIRDHQMVIFRFHDHWHMTEPDGIHIGMTRELGWEDFRTSPGEMIFQLPSQTVGSLAKSLKDHFSTPAVRVVGDPGMMVNRVGMAVGSSGSQRQIMLLRRDDVEVLIAGETHEWETVEWVRDAHAQGKKKALILLGHANSEEAGMEYCAEWLSKFITEIPVRFIAAGDPFWGPQ